MLGLLMLVCCSVPARAQTDRPAGDAVSLTLGRALAPLTGPWKFQVGDSPVDPATGRPLWAKPEFDDSKWETVDLTPKGDANLYTVSSAYVSGWGARGHAGYTGYAWYRIRVKVRAQPGEALALAGPKVFDDAYQVFLNGALLGGFGRFDGKEPEFFYAEPVVFPLGALSGAGGGRDETEVIAFRFWVSPPSMLNQTDGGGFHVAPQLGTAAAVQTDNRIRWLELIRENAAWVISGLMFSLLAVIAFVLLLLNHRDRFYLWMMVISVLTSLGDWDIVAISTAPLLTVTTDIWMANIFLIPALKFAWFWLVWSWIGMKGPRWLLWAMGVVELVNAFGIAGEYYQLGSMVPPSFAITSQHLAMLTSGIYSLVICWLAYQGIRKLGLEGWLALPVLLFSRVEWLAAAFGFLHIPKSVQPFGILLNLQQMAAIVLAIWLFGLLIRRWVASARVQRRVMQEMKQAQEVQQVLIPEAVAGIPGFAIASVYHPAGQVGGDFFQILPAKDGGVLVCIGDVSGKGMPAAMTVSLLVGALRSLADYTQSPGEILSGMNQRMLGRSRGGFTTCLVMLAAADGTVTVANGGHIAPYLNGKEVTLENGLPLGLAAAAEYPETTFHWKQDEQIALLTDGVVEARAASGELFGFERTAAIAGKSAEAIAAIAREFGQDDDITVLTLTRLGKHVTQPQMVTVLSPSIA